MLKKGMKHFDLVFSRQVDLTYKRETNYKTVVGGIASIILLASVGAFAVQGCIKWYSRQIISLNNEERKFPDHEHEHGLLSPEALAFNMSFGFANKLNPEIGFFTVEHV